MKVLVDWPEDLTQKYLTGLSYDGRGFKADHVDALRRLAAIAPEAPKPVEEVKRWVWINEKGLPCSEFEIDGNHPPWATLVLYPRKPAPKPREVTLWRYRTSVAQDIYAKSTNWAPYDHDAWERVGTGWVEE